MVFDLRDPAQVATAQRAAGFVSKTGTEGADIIIGVASEPNAIYGGGRGDLIIGGGLGDELHGEGVVLPAIFPPPPISDDLRGPDTILGFGGHDTIRGDWGDDLLDGGSGNDKLFGGDGNDSVRGGRGHDALNGDAGDDLLHGGTGNDTLTGGVGSDYLTGGAGVDRFVADAAFDGSPAAGTDVITDFERGTDVIDLKALNEPEMFYGMRFDEAFVFRGQGTMVDYPDGETPGGPGQLRFEFRGNTTVVQLDVAQARFFMRDATACWADGTVDAEIILIGRHDLSAADFIL